MRQRIVVSGLGGQGVLLLTRVLAEAAASAGHEVLTSETHGMAQRGGAVISTVKVGPFRAPLLAHGEAEIGLFLHADNRTVHGHYLRRDAAAFLNAPPAPGALAVDASALALAAGAPRSANLALLGYAAGSGRLFAPPATFRTAIAHITAPPHRAGNLAAFEAGVEAPR